MTQQLRDWVAHAPTHQGVRTIWVATPTVMLFLIDFTVMPSPALLFSSDSEAAGGTPALQTLGCSSVRENAILTRRPKLIMIRSVVEVKAMANERFENILVFFILEFIQTRLFPPCFDLWHFHGKHRFYTAEDLWPHPINLLSWAKYSQ